MTARNHHSLPRLLLRGFASRGSGDDYHVYQFRRDQSPNEPNIKNVATERDFYDDEIEDRLASKEGRYGELLKDARQGTVTAVDFPLIADFVSHLIIRTRALRRALTDTGQQMLEFLQRTLVSAEGEQRLRRMALPELSREIAKHAELSKLMKLLSPAQEQEVISQAIAATDIQGRARSAPSLPRPVA